MIIESIPKSGRDGDRVYVNHPRWKIVRQYVKPRNPRTVPQQDHRKVVGAVSKRWSALAADQYMAWRIAAANNYFLTETGEQVRRNCYHLFMGINIRRAELGLAQFDLPPARPSFQPNPVTELSITNVGGRIIIKLRVSGQPDTFILVQGPAPKGSIVRQVQHFPFLGLLPPPEDGWSDITELYVARYGVPEVNRAVWIRVFQHIDGWIDMPKVFRARVPPPTP
jgi:hypothetical protein